MWRTCTTDDDCVGETSPQGPDCVGGICAPTRCGNTIGSCASYVAAGEPCASSALSLVNNVVPNPAAMCAPGLVCQGVPGDGGLGTCVVCRPTWAAAASTTPAASPVSPARAETCEIPPSTGACVNGLCEVGVAYCDNHSNTCQPIRAEGESCTVDPINPCAPDLLCNGTVCEPPS